MTSSFQPLRRGTITHCSRSALWKIVPIPSVGPKHFVIHVFRAGSTKKNLQKRFTTSSFILKATVFERLPPKFAAQLVVTVPLLNLPPWLICYNVWHALQHCPRRKCLFLFPFDINRNSTCFSPTGPGLTCWILRLEKKQSCIKVRLSSHRI